MKTSQSLLFLSVLGLVLAPLSTTVRADSGVSESRVALPDGPGSIGGVGENVNVSSNMGSLSYLVPMEVPAGFEELTPELGLSYDSAAGASVVGIGWGMALPSIERATFRGLPEYDAEDLFVVDESEQLVRVSQADGRAVYRTRFEKAFIRYAWNAVGDGKAGYWTAEQPNGLISYYGADRNGQLVAEARAEADGGKTFRYSLVETVDPFGHRLHYGYVRTNGYPLLDTLDYVHDAAGKARFSVRFAYQARPDAISNCKPGFELLLTQRLSEVRIFSNAEQIRSYTLEYEGETQSGGMSRLRSVTRKGQSGVVYPVKHTFGYSQALGGACTTNCQKPFVVDMGTLPGGVNLKSGRATLIDINGDALPDVLTTNESGQAFFLSEPSPDGRPKFAMATHASKAATSGFILGSPGVQVLDVNGDGFTDMISSRTGQVLCNDGSGDWNGTSCLGNATLGTFMSDAPGEEGPAGDPFNVRFFDYDDDKRIDLLRSTVEGAEVRVSRPGGYEAITIDPIGTSFDPGTLELADMNGDGLQDPVEIMSGGQIRFRLNLGFGKWAPWQTVTLTGFGETALLSAEIEDINGDGLDDVVVVTPSSVQYALNRNASRFDAPVSVGAENIEGTLPTLSDTTSILFADMNGNGSNDIVWAEATGHFVFLDLFPVKPNLLSRIENAIGMVQEVQYSTSLSELARDKSWSYRLTTAMNVVKRVDSWVTLTGGAGGAGLHEIIELSYRDGFYDGVEKQFRGFARVEQHLLGDNNDSQQPGLSVSTFDVGATDAYHHGLMLGTQSFALEGSDSKPLRQTKSVYADCPVAEVPSNGLSFPIRHICQTEAWTTLQEGAPESEWATTETTSEYDGYGNVIRASSLGVVSRGSIDAPQSCAACKDADDVVCGEDCSGDETFAESEYVVPGSATKDKWFLNLPLRSVLYGQKDGPVDETLSFYDGDAFVGLPAGQLTSGKLTRVMRRIAAGSDALSPQVRARFDDHGNVIDSLDPLGDPANETGHRTRMQYDANGLNLTATERLSSDADGAYSLRQEISYDTSFNLPSEQTDWMVMRGSAAESARNSTRYRYDEHGRVASLIRPGDTDTAPSATYGYELANPVSSIRILERSQPGKAADSETIKCLDGRSRAVQTLRRVEDARYIADGFRELNSRGAISRVYQPYELDAGTCAMKPPADVLFTAYRYDPNQRLLRITHPDAADFDGKASERITSYGPLSTSDVDENGHAATRFVDGDGRVVAIARPALDGDDKLAVTRLRYDSLDHMTGFIDPAGNVRTQEYDLLGRVLRVKDPNAGETRYTYDLGDNLLSSTDAEGAVVRYAYDGLNRTAETWDGADREKSLVRYQYDRLTSCSACSNLASRLAEMTYPVVLGVALTQGSDRFGYDARGRDITTTRTLEKHAFTTERAYDGLDRLIETTYPDGQKLAQTYDGAGRLLTIPGVVDDVVYDARGLTAERTYANKAKASFEYDSRLELSAHAVRDGRGDPVFALAFKRDRVADLKTATASGKSRKGALARDFEHGYDAWQRVRSTSFGKGDSAEKITSTYDAIDNVTSESSSLGAESRMQLGAFEYDADHPNALSSVASVAYTYDASGQLTKRDQLELSWDYQNRLVTAARGARVVAKLAYGAGAERVIKEEAGHVVYYVSPEFEVRDGVSSVYAFDGERLARLESDALSAELMPDADEDGAISVADAWLMQADTRKSEEVQRVLAGAARAALPVDEITFLHGDVNENVVAATDEAGELIAERAFYLQGSERAATGFVDDHGYTGHELDTSTGLVRYPYRYLDATSGRWISPDPGFATVSTESIDGDGEATSAYAFVANNPANSVDPTGLLSVKLRVKANRIKRRIKQQRKELGLQEKNIGKAEDAVKQLRAEYTENFAEQRRINKQLDKRTIDPDKADKAIKSLEAKRVEASGKEVNIEKHILPRMRRTADRMKDSIGEDRAKLDAVQDGSWTATHRAEKAQKKADKKLRKQRLPPAEDFADLTKVLDITGVSW